MKLGTNCALLVVDIQQEDFQTMTVDNLGDPAWDCIRSARRVLDVFRARRLPVIHIQEAHRADHVDFGRELDGAEGLHCLEDSPGTDFAWLTYPLPGEYRVVKRRYSAFFGTDLEILLREMKKNGVSIPYKAVVTETNLGWLFHQLYDELAAEHEAMSK